MEQEAELHRVCYQIILIQPIQLLNANIVMDKPPCFSVCISVSSVVKKYTTEYMEQEGRVTQSVTSNHFTIRKQYLKILPSKSNGVVAFVISFIEADFIFSLFKINFL